MSLIPDKASKILDPEMTRRTFLKDATAAALGMGFLYRSEVWGEGNNEPDTLTLPGRTVPEVSEVFFKNRRILQERLLDQAITRDINLIHTSPGHGEGRDIRLFGEEVKRRRSQVFLALKKNPVHGIDEELRRLNTDYVDILVPPLHIGAMPNPDLPGAFEKLKAQGKIRFTGFASHDPGPEMMDPAATPGYFDVVFIACDLANQDLFDLILTRTQKKKHLGVMAMKAKTDIDQPRAQVSAGIPLLQKLGFKATESSAEIDRSGALSSALAVLLHTPQVDTLLIGTASKQHTDRLPEYTSDGGSHRVTVADIRRGGIYQDRRERHLAMFSYRTL